MTDLQQKYFEILKNIKDEKVDLGDINNQKIEDIINQANLLFSEVSNPIELKLDARISAETVNLSSVYFEKKLRNRKITTQKFIQHLNRAMNPDVSEDMSNHTNKLNTFFMELTNKYYGIKFMEFQTIGEIKCRQPREITGKEEKEHGMTQISQCNLKDDTFIAKIDKIVDLIGDQKIDYYRAVLDPNSFTKTVENIFSLSFAIKLKKISLISDEQGNFFLSKRAPVNASGNLETVTPSQETEIKHFSSTMDHEEYRQLVDVLEIDKPFIDI